METSMAVFRGKEIRKTIHNNEWWFSVADFVAPILRAFFALFSPLPKAEQESRKRLKEKK